MKQTLVTKCISWHSVIIRYYPMWSVAEAIVKHRVHFFIATSAGNGKHNTSSGFMVVQGSYTPTTCLPNWSLMYVQHIPCY